MKNTALLSATSILALSTSMAIAQPDLICSAINSATNFGAVDGIAAYSFGTVLCNVGDAPVAWEANTNEHPVISQTLYRLSNGQFHQIGISFVRHTTFPLAGNLCNLGCTPAGFDALGAGCSDTSGSAINGSQGLMGPRSEIKAFTGFYPYPFTSINQTGDAIYKRLQVSLADISDPNALYFIETQVVTSAETTAATRANNASYRQVTFTPGSASANLVGPTYAEQAAIFAWRDHGLGIGMPDPSVLIDEVTIPGDGIIHVGSKATLLGDGDYRYDYVIHNQNSEQIPVNFNHSLGMQNDANSFIFHGISYHDDVDENIENGDWNSFQAFCDSIGVWQPIDLFDYSTTNAIRWGTAYSFSFSTTQEPDILRLGDSSINYLSMSNTVTYLPIDGVVGPTRDLNPCDKGCNEADIAIPFDALNFFDVSAFLDAFNNQEPNADLAEPLGTWNFFDVSAFLGYYNAGCP